MAATIDDLEFDVTTGKRAVYEDFAFTPHEGHVDVENRSHEDSAEHTYDVTVRGGRPVRCSCPAYEYHCDAGEACKHMAAVALAEPVLEAASGEGQR